MADVQAWIDVYERYAGRGVKLTPTQARIVAALESGRIVSIEGLADVLWGHDPNGGPQDARNNIGVHIVRLRKAGFDIRVYYGAGYQLVSAPALTPA